MNRDQIVKIARLTGCKNFVGIFNAFVGLKCRKKLTDSQLSLPHGMNKNVKEK